MLSEVFHVDILKVALCIVLGEVSPADVATVLWEYHQGLEEEAGLTKFLQVMIDGTQKKCEFFMHIYMISIPVTNGIADFYSLF